MMVPLPPAVAAPPRKTAVIACSSKPVPLFGLPAAVRAVIRTPASPAIPPDRAYMPTLTRLTEMPARRAAVGLPPMA